MNTSLKISSIAVLGILAILLSGVIVFKIDIVILLILSILYVGVIAKFDGKKTDDIIEGMKEGCFGAFVGLLFFLLIGAIMGAWIQSGTVPALVYYGLDILSPKFFLVSSFIICSIVSLVLGTSWGTIGTVGIAIMGVATSSGMDIPLGMVAGSIVSGAWFGDKMSPISDSTVLTATSAKADIYKHIKTMTYTTLPSYIITIIIYAIINLNFVSSNKLDLHSINNIKQTLESEFYLGILVFIPVIVLVVLSVLKVNAILSLLASIASGVICSVFFQDNSLTSSFAAIMNGMTLKTGVAEVDTLVNRGGINSMLPTFLLGFTALCLGGVLQKLGYLHTLVYAITAKLKRVFSVILTTMITCVMGNAVFGDTYLTIVLNANMYDEIYKKRDLDETMLSRTIEEATTMSTPLIPWTAASAFIVGALGIQTAQYAPYTILNIVNPILSLGMTFIGIGVVKRIKK